MGKTRTYQLRNLKSAEELDKCIYFERLGKQPHEVIRAYQYQGPLGEADKRYKHISVRDFRIEFWEQEGKTCATLSGTYSERVKTGRRIDELWYPGKEVREKFRFAGEPPPLKALSEYKTEPGGLIFAERSLEDIASLEEKIIWGSRRKGILQKVSDLFLR